MPLPVIGDPAPCPFKSEFCRPLPDTAHAAITSIPTATDCDWNSASGRLVWW